MSELRILVVDDAPALRALIKEVIALRDQG